MYICNIYIDKEVPSHPTRMHKTPKKWAKYKINTHSNRSPTANFSKLLVVLKQFNQENKSTGAHNINNITQYFFCYVFEVILLFIYIFHLFDFVTEGPLGH